MSEYMTEYKKGDMVRVLDEDSVHYKEVGTVSFLSTGGALVVAFEGGKFPVSISPDLVEPAGQ